MPEFCAAMPADPRPRRDIKSDISVPGVDPERRARGGLGGAAVIAAGLATEQLLHELGGGAREQRGRTRLDADRLEQRTHFCVWSDRGLELGQARQDLTLLLGD